MNEIFLFNFKATKRLTREFVNREFNSLGTMRALTTQQYLTEPLGDFRFITHLVKVGKFMEISFHEYKLRRKLMEFQA